MKRWVSCPAEVTYLLIIPGQYEKCVAVLWFLFELHKFFAAHACLQPIAFVRSFMLWVLRLHFAVLLFGDRLLACCLLYSACWAYAVQVYRCLGETTRGKGGSPAAIPLPLPGFLPQSPAFLLPHPPMGDDVKLHVSMMLHKTQRNEIFFMKSWERFSPSVFPKRGEGCGKESARENRWEGRE